jgi:hypothetical protein
MSLRLCALVAIRSSHGAHQTKDAIACSRFRRSIAGG